MRRGPQHGGVGGGEQADRVGPWVGSSPPLASSLGARHCVRCTLAACILQEPGGWGYPGLVGGPMGIRIREVRQAKPTGPDIRELTAGFVSPNFSFRPITLKPSLKAAGAALWDISHGLFDRFSKTGGTSYSNWEPLLCHLPTEMQAPRGHVKCPQGCVVPTEAS